ncbi:MAG: DUF1549 domain-containing protein [Pirellulaceae bacterium]|jgi:hypothetical protein|nr:DUF1549 domain-containing protein [Pirellulaceae bacterium]MDP7017529.1 DUF1549 domain-containing protein [Pirellulaceae bacterium]
MMRRQSKTNSWILAVAASLLAPAVSNGQSPPPFQLSHESIELFAGQSQQVLADGAAENGRIVDLTASVNYASSDPAVASVTAAGLVVAHRAGRAEIAVTWKSASQKITVAVQDARRSPPLRFVTDIVPVLTKRGCNSGSCHGKATGQNGFRLSLLGFEPAFDYRALVLEARGRRLFPADPDRSLVLQKAIGDVPHGGGARLRVEDDDYQALRDWIVRGTVGPSDSDPQLVRLELQPSSRVLARESRQQVVVTAFYSDATSRDVTRQAVYLSSDDRLAAADESGLISTFDRSGIVSVMARFGGKIATFYGSAPLPRNDAERSAVRSRLSEVEKHITSPVDRLLFQQWSRLGVAPSNEVSDAAFIRRVTIDICGSLPTSAEVRSYVSDTALDKRSRLIDRLLRQPAYASYFAMKWGDVLQNRGAGYSTRQQRAGTSMFGGWIRDSIAANKPYDQFVYEIITASGSQRENPPTVWHRSVRTMPDYVESVAQAFLGVRIQCAQCHHHPFERWSQTDYYGLAAVFARLGRKGGFADAEVPTDEVIYLKDRGEVKHPRTGAIVAPRALGGPDLPLGPYDDPRSAFADWMTDPENPFFARTMANRMWAHFLGRGVIDPIDDARITNPPSNPELLDFLANDFARHHYDVKHLIRTICNSLAYRLSATASELNRRDTQSFARFYPRRLGAEVLLDGISQVLEAPTAFSGGPGSFPAGTRAIELPDENVPLHFLDVFGRPARTTACECERIDAPALAQGLELVNSTELQRKLTVKGGFAAQLAENKLTHEENVGEIFARLFAREPDDREMQVAKGFLASEKDRAAAYQSLLWSLLVTNEFLFNH